ncbi:DUF1189 domain-containing protein [Bacillus sp. DNRA2]|uniref:DUF1189 domain-containing protein n=1 Tax=Bacillus sp. DNRA2 TaxID=2723053 RepID=UPI00145F7068|nr:DUF1189 domain-containing protein [Bacillus sp. DNRA2]NMD71864.1 DUF1189 domain-containing protein [Bacillus sp. DNRA2]
MNVFMQLIKSCYSPKDIAITRFQGIGKTILFVFLLTLVSIIPSIYFLSASMTNVLGEVKNTVQSDIPDFTIKNGQLKSDADKPITVTKDDFVILFDSTGDANANDLKNIEFGIGILKDEFVLVQAENTQTYPYSMFESFTLSKGDVLDLIEKVDSSLFIIIPLMVLMNYIFASGVKFIEISILAVFGLFIKNMTRRRLNYGQLWRMSAYSVTLPTLFFTIMNALHTTVPGGFFLNWIVGYLVLFLAVKEIPQSKNA